jgi:hypothetical protein
MRFLFFLQLVYSGKFSGDGAAALSSGYAMNAEAFLAIQLLVELAGM